MRSMCARLFSKDTQAQMFVTHICYSMHMHVFPIVLCEGVVSDMHATHSLIVNYESTMQHEVSLRQICDADERIDL